MADYLEKLSPQDVAAFYRRLALHINKKFGGKSLAAELLLHWLDGKGAKKVFSSSYLDGVTFVDDYMKSEVRPVLLTEKKAARRPPIWAGIIPRINRLPGFDKDPMGGPYRMMYEGPSVEIPLAVQARLALGFAGATREADLLYGLHSFAIQTNVIAQAARMQGTQYRVVFAEWKSKARDSYHWDPTKHITVPNPDYQSTAQNAVAPKEDKIVVYHMHAFRVEQAGLARPFDDESTEWRPTDAAITAPATVDVARCRATPQGVECR